MFLKLSPNMEEKASPNTVIYRLVGTELKQFFFILRVVHSLREINHFEGYHNFSLTQQINNRTGIYLLKAINGNTRKRC